MLVTEITAQSIDEALRKQLANLEMGVDSREVGTVIQVGDGIARVDGLKSAMAGELLEFIGEGGKTVYGLVQNLEEDEIGAVLLGDVTAIKENDQVKESGMIKKELEKLEMIKKQQLGEIKNLIDYEYALNETRKKNEQKEREKNEKEEKMRKEKEKQQKLKEMRMKEQEEEKREKQRKEEEEAIKKYNEMEKKKLEEQRQEELRQKAIQKERQRKIPGRLPK